jgi:hypothetical protein
MLSGPAWARLLGIVHAHRMSWDLTVRSAEGSIGSLDAVRQSLSRIFPTARFGSEPSGVEKVRAAEAQGIKFPAFLRETMISQPARHGADYEVDRVSLRFYFGSEYVVREIHVEVSGTGDPFPLLRQLASVHGWQVVDDSSGKVLTEDAQSAGTGWATYQRMLAEARDHQ